MNDVLQIAAGCGVGEDDRRKSATIQGAIGRCNLRSEALNHRHESRRPWCHDIAGKRIRVNGRNAESFQSCPHMTLSSGDTASQGDASNP